MAKEESSTSTSLYEIFGGIIYGVALIPISAISITSSKNKVIKVIVIFLIIIRVGLYYLLREHFHIYNNNNDTANQIYFYSSIGSFLLALYLLLKG